MLFSLKNSIQACSIHSHPITLWPRLWRCTKSLVLPQRGNKTVFWGWLSLDVGSPPPSKMSRLFNSLGFTSGKWKDVFPFFHSPSQTVILSVLMFQIPEDVTAGNLEEEIGWNLVELFVINPWNKIYLSSPHTWQSYSQQQGFTIVRWKYLH